MKYTISALLLIIVGIMQLMGDLMGLPVLKVLGLVSHASPAPKVFTAQNGFETYSGNFYINWFGKDQQEHSIHLTPKNYASIRGPYNRRNAYGAALSYAPVLYAEGSTRDMQQSIMRYGFCNKAPLMQELGIDPLQVEGNIRIEIKPRQILSSNHTWKLSYEIICNE